MSSQGYSDETLKFLRALARNNRRDWFQDNKQRYEQHVREPSLEFIRAIQPRLQKISPFFVASDRRVGGSLMRVYRDTRFSSDKTPYKTNIGIHFRHQMGKDVHAPGFYVHVEMQQCFLGVGLWHPDAEALGKIRNRIVDDPAAWKRARDNKQFRGVFELSGDSLKRPPRGIDAAHPMIEDLKRKDFVAIHQYDASRALEPDFVAWTANAFAASRPFMRFLCETTDVPF